MKKRIQDKLKRRRKKLSPDEQERRDLQIMMENLAAARKIRDTLALALEENPDPQGFVHLEQLDHSIYLEKRRVDSQVMRTARRDLKLLTKDLHNTVDETGDEQFLRLGDEAQPVKNLERLIALRHSLAATFAEKINPDEKPEELIAEFDSVIEAVKDKIADRRECARRHAAQKAEADRQYAETQALYKQVFPDHVDIRAQLNESLRDSKQMPLTADGTEYEMTEDYKEAVYKREAAIEMRDMCRVQIEKIIAENRQKEDFQEFVQSIDDLDQWIVDAGKALQREKETHQAACHSRAAAEIVAAEYENMLQDAIAENPHLLLGGKPKPKGQ